MNVIGHDAILFHAHRFVVIFHLQNALFHDFVRELREVDHVVLAEIYAAREVNTIGISSHDLEKEIPGSVCFDTLPEVAEYLRSIAREGDIIVTVGAGDIFKAGEMMLK